jgi:hypothetical protein
MAFSSVDVIQLNLGLFPLLPVYPEAIQASHANIRTILGKQPQANQFALNNATDGHRASVVKDMLQKTLILSTDALRSGFFSLSDFLRCAVANESLIEESFIELCSIVSVASKEIEKIVNVVETLRVISQMGGDMLEQSCNLASGVSRCSF